VKGQGTAGGGTTGGWLGDGDERPWSQAGEASPGARSSRRAAPVAIGAYDLLDGALSWGAKGRTESTAAGALTETKGNAVSALRNGTLPARAALCTSAQGSGIPGASMATTTLPFVGGLST
jgi:hypothetical protein